jgi:hypothetical protein
MEMAMDMRSKAVGPSGALSRASVLQPLVLALLLAGGATGCTSTTSVDDDSSPPIAAIAAPASGAVLSGMVTITATASDDVAVASVRVLVDGAELCARVATPYACDWNTATAANGAHTLTAVAQDAAGNSTASSAVTVTVSNGAQPPDTTPPTISLTTPGDGQSVSGTVTVTATASDDVAVASVRVLVDGAELCARVATPYACDWNTATAANGAHTLTSVAQDAAGNSTASSAVTVTVSNGAQPPDTTPPTVSVTTPTEGQSVSGTVTVTATASDNVAVASVRVLVDGAELCARVAAPYACAWNTAAAANGAHTLTAVAQDAAGNSTTSAARHVTVSNGTQPPDTTPPTISLTAPTEGQNVSGTVSVTATASDDVAVASVRVLLDGAQLCMLTTAPYACAWSTATAPNGAHTLIAVAQDAAGNSTTSAARHVTVSNAPTSFLRVSTTGTDSGNCKASPCRTIVYGISQMVGGDTLVVGNGVYPEANAIRNVPSGNAGPDGVPGTADDVYTTVMAEIDFGVLIDGSAWPDTWIYGVRIENASYVKVQGFRVHGRQSNTTGGPMTVLSSHHVKIVRCGFAYAGVTGNTANVDLGPDNDYVLIEECYAFGGGRYQFVVYWSDHTVVRRSLARNDYWADVLQSAAFTNYDSLHTMWQNNIAVDSDESCCSGHLYAGFFNENKTDHAPDTSEVFLGNIVLNYRAFYAAHLDWVVSGTRVLADNIYWDSMGGYWGDQGPGVTASFAARNLTSGANRGIYDGPNQGPALGTGMSIYGNLTNQVVDSIFASNRSYGIADYVSGDYNAFSGNGANYGGQHMPTPGAHDVTSVAILPSVLKYLPRGPEDGSPLATAGSTGGRVGAQVLWKIGVDGTIWGQPGYDTVRDAAHGFGGAADRLWPFPNEVAIKSDMAAYGGGGLAGQRGFCSAGKQLNGTSDVTLTSYIWEYLGNPMPATLY